MKGIITSIIAGLTNSINQLKAFNPFLGETFSCRFEDGTEYYSEYVNHIPPIIRILIIGHNYKFYGTILNQHFMKLPPNPILITTQ